MKYRTRLRTRAIPTTCHSLFKGLQASKQANKHPPQTKLARVRKVQPQQHRNGRSFIPHKQATFVVPRSNQRKLGRKKHTFGQTQRETMVWMQEEPPSKQTRAHLQSSRHTDTKTRWADHNRYSHVVTRHRHYPHSRLWQRTGDRSQA